MILPVVKATVFGHQLKPLKTFVSFIDHYFCHN